VFSQARLNHSFLLVPRKVWMDMAGSPSGGRALRRVLVHQRWCNAWARVGPLEKFDYAIDK